MKTILKTILLSAVTLAAIKSQAQSVSYTVDKNDAYDIKNFSLAIDPFFLDFNGQNGYSFGWGFRGDYLMGKTLQFNVDYRQGFGTKGYLISDNNTKNYGYKEAGVALTLSSKTKTRNLRIVLSQSSSTSGGVTTTTTTYIKGGVPGEVRSMVALRGGLYMMTNTLDFKSLSDSLLTFDDKKGGEFTYKDSATAKNLGQYGAVYSTAIYAGFNFKQIRQLILDVDGYGIRGNVMYRDFFVDFLFSPVLFLKNYKDDAGTPMEVKYDVKYSKSSVIGWRMGWFIRKPKDQGFSMKFEFGERPGYTSPDKIKNWYGMFTYGLYIPLKIKPIAEHP
jgi:hypothetical protein